MHSWIVVTAEYPPALGGVSDYTGHLARGLAKHGDAVAVWAPSPAVENDPSVVVHELPRGFDAGGRRAVERAVESAANSVVLVEYVPLGFGGYRFVRWLTKLPCELWIMFHEVAYPFVWRQTLRHRVLGAATHWMARMLFRRADRVFVSTPACERTLSRLGTSRRPCVWLPIPSNVPNTALHRRTDVLTGLGLDPEKQVVAHFSTFAPFVADRLSKALAELLRRDPSVQVLLVGSGSEGFAERLLGVVPAARGRLAATGRSSVERVADAIDASDVLVFPFPDGITTRRTSVMAALALGKAVVTTRGVNTEPLWSDERCVDLVPDDPNAMAERTLALLAAPSERRELGERARRVYESRFALERIVETLRAERL